MNKFGTLFTVQIFGESHGACVGITIDGCPAGLPLKTADFVEDMERRKGGKQKGTTPRQEDDIPLFKAGLFNDMTTGAPIMMLLKITILEVVIMKSNVPFLDQVMPILQRIINLEALKIIEEAGILAEG